MAGHYPPPPYFVGGRAPFVGKDLLTPPSGIVFFPPTQAKELQTLNAVLSSNWNEDAAIVDLVLNESQTQAVVNPVTKPQSDIQDNWVTPPSLPSISPYALPVSPLPTFLVGERYQLELYNALMDSWAAPTPRPVIAYNLTPPSGIQLTVSFRNLSEIIGFWNAPPPLAYLGQAEPLEPVTITPPSGQVDLPGARIPNEVLTQWIPPPPLPQPSVVPHSPWNIAVLPPAIQELKVPNEVLVNWIPPPPLPQPSRTINASPLSGPPVLAGAYIPQGLLNSWIPKDPQPIVAYNLFPPSGDQGLIQAFVPKEVLIGWIPPPPQPPIAINLIPPSGQLIQFGRSAANFLSILGSTWLPKDPQPIVPYLQAPPTGPGFQMGRSTYNLNMLIGAGWVPPAPQPIVSTIPIPPPGQNPPFAGTYLPFGFLNSWIPKDPQPIVAVNLTAPAGPPDLPGTWIGQAIFDAWIPPPPQPLPTSGASGSILLTPPTGFVPVPIGAWVSREILINWLPTPPMPIPSTAINLTPPTPLPTFPAQKIEEMLIGWLPPPAPWYELASNLAPGSGQKIIAGRGLPNLIGLTSNSWIPPDPLFQTAINLLPPSGPVAQILPGTKVGLEILNSWIPAPPSQVFYPFVPALQYSFLGSAIPLELLQNWSAFWTPTPQPPLSTYIGFISSFVPGIPPNLYSRFIRQEVLEEWKTYNPIPQPPIVGRVIPIYRPDNPQFRGTAVPTEVQNAWSTWGLPQPYYQYGASIFFQYNAVFSALTKFGFVYNTINSKVTIEFG